MLRTRLKSIWEIMDIKAKSNINLLIVFAFSVIVNLIFLPTDFRFNHDAVLSPTGLLMTESYKNVPFDVSLSIPGFYFSGDFIRYANWPPLHFITLNIWDSLFGCSLFINRLFSVLVSSLTVLFLNLLIIKLTDNKRLALIGSIIFFFFPFRLLYSSLIFCDIWVPFFWTSGLLLKLISDEKSNDSSITKKYFYSILLGLYLGIGTLYSWQTFFMLPTFIIYDLIKLKSIKVKSIITFTIGLFVFVLWMAWILFTSHSITSNSTIQQFLNRSILGFIYSPAFWFVFTA